MGLEEKILQDMKDAMRSGDKLRVETIRLLRAQLKNVSIEKGDTLEDEDIFQVLTKEAKKRNESIDLYKQGGREELEERERQELEIIQSYLPEALSHDEIVIIVDQAIKESEAQTIKDMGKVMGCIMPKLKGRADGKMVQELVKQKLS